MSERNICDVVEKKLRKDLKAEKRGVWGFMVGDVTVDVTSRHRLYGVRRDFKIAIDAKGRRNIRGSYFKEVAVNPEDIDAYLEKSYPALLEKVKTTIAKLQSAVDKQKMAANAAREWQKEIDIQRITFIKESGLGKLLSPRYDDDSTIWQNKDTGLRLHLNDDTFTVKDCPSLSPEQVKGIIKVLEG